MSTSLVFVVPLFSILIPLTMVIFVRWKSRQEYLEACSNDKTIQNPQNDWYWEINADEYSPTYDQIYEHKRAREGASLPCTPRDEEERIAMGDLNNKSIVDIPIELEFEENESARPRQSEASTVKLGEDELEEEGMRFSVVSLKRMPLKREQKKSLVIRLSGGNDDAEKE